MRAQSCLADWQHDSALTPNTDVLHPNDAILNLPCDTEQTQFKTLSV